MKSRVMALVAEALELWGQRQAAKAVLEEDYFVAELAASLLAPSELGQEEVVALAVHTARLVLKHSRRDLETVPVSGAGAPS